jgi:hypothetical protein
VANSGPSVTSVWCSPFLAAAVDAGGVELVDEVVVHDATEHRRRCRNVGADGDHHRAPAARGGELADERVGVVRPRGRTRDERHAHRGRLRLEHLAGKTVRARAPTVPAEQRQQGARPCARFDREIERERRVLAAAPRAHDLPDPARSALAVPVRRPVGAPGRRRDVAGGHPEGAGSSLAAP